MIPPRTAAAEPIPARVAFVELGPGDPGLLTTAARAVLAEADVVILDTLTDEESLRVYLRREARVVKPTPGLRDYPLTQSARVALILSIAMEPQPTAVEAAHATDPDSRTEPTQRLIVRVTDGCPSACHDVDAELRACREAGLEVEIVPGVSAAAAVPAYAGIPLTGAGAPAVAIWCTAHDGARAASLADDALTVIALGSPEQLAHAIVALAAAGRSSGTPVAIIERGTTWSQRTLTTTLADAPRVLRHPTNSLTSTSTFTSPLVAVIGEVVGESPVDWFESKPLFGWRVLVPRTKEQAGSMTDRLQRFGATAEVVPTISVEPPRHAAPLLKAINGLVTGHYTWVGFTSVNAVHAIREQITALGLDVRCLAGVRVAAVGGVTAAALRQWGIEPDLLPEGEESAAGLLEVWPEHDPLLDPLRSVLLPRADIATETLVAGLLELGWDVDDVTAYRTVRAAPPPAPVRDAIKTGEFDAVLFTSSSTVRNLIGIAGKPHASTVVGCIGPATARTAEEHGLTVRFIADRASAQSLVDGLAAYGRSLAQQTPEGLRTPLPRRSGSSRRRRVQK